MEIFIDQQYQEAFKKFEPEFQVIRPLNMDPIKPKFGKVSETAADEKDKSVIIIRVLDKHKISIALNKQIRALLSRMVAESVSGSRYSDPPGLFPIDFLWLHCPIKPEHHSELAFNAARPRYCPDHPKSRLVPVE